MVDGRLQIARVILNIDFEKFDEKAWQRMLLFGESQTERREKSSGDSERAARSSIIAKGWRRPERREREQRRTGASK